MVRRVVIRMASEGLEDALEKSMRRLSNATVSGRQTERTHFGLAEDAQTYGLIGFSADVASCGAAPNNQDVKILAGCRTLSIEVGQANPFASRDVIRGTMASLPAEHVLKNAAALNSNRSRA